MTNIDFKEINNKLEDARKESYNLIDKITKNGYKLSYRSCKYLTDNFKMVMHSLKENMNSIIFVGSAMKNDPDIFKYMLLNGYRYNYDTIANKYLKEITDNEVFSKCLERMFDDNSKKIDDFSEICCAAFKNIPTIKMFDSVFEYVVDEKWKDYRSENLDKFGNVFGKICAELKNNCFFDKAIENIEIISELESVLDEKYDVLYSAMNEYFNIYHSAIPNKLEKIQSSKNIIAKLSALYVAKSKGYYKKSKLEELYDYIAQYFILRLENPYINKKLIQFRKKVQFKNAYLVGDKEVCSFIDSVVQTYNKTIDSKLVEELIYAFLILDCSKLDDVINKPPHYDDYERYEKAVKLIKRLNNGYISYDGVEVLNYKDIISYDTTTNKYVYVGIKLSENDLKNFSEYRKILQVFLKIKKDIISKIQTITFDGKIDDSIVENLRKELPLTDEYYEFDTSCVLNSFNLYDLIILGAYTINPDVLENEASFYTIYNLLVNNGLMWLLLFGPDSFLRKRGVNKDIFEIINNMTNTLELAKGFNFNTNNFGELLSAYNINNYADKASLAIIGKSIIGELIRNRDFIDDDTETVIDKAKGLICQMTLRNKSTVPYVSGKHLNYNYSLYDSQDETILLAGINTDACFRVCGNDNDFLHYCALNKNGFVIKITDDFGNFIGRAAGFRHGNCIYINQLRTIYDNSDTRECTSYQTETDEIMRTLQVACEEIINTSLNNSVEENKIEFVFITKSYSMSCYKSNVPNDVENKIGGYPMDIYSPNWDEFLEETLGLQEDYWTGVGFLTDYGDYSLICLAGIKSPEDLTPDDIKMGDVPALYERQRNKIIVSDKPTESLIKKVNKIQAIASWYTESEFEMVYIPMTAKIFLGDNWYIIYDNNKVIDGILLADDEKAKVELDAVMKILEDYTKEMNLDEFVSKSQTSNLSVEVESDFVKSIGTLQ